MKRRFVRRPSASTAIACVALFVALGGVSWAFATGSIDTREIKNETILTEDIRKGGVRPDDIRNDSIRTEDLRNNEVRGVDIRNSTIRGIEVALNSITGADIAEDTLEAVPSADTVDGIDSADFARSGDVGRFSLRLTAGQTQTVATHGQVSVLARCVDGGAQDEVRLYASTPSADVLMDGAEANDDHLTSGDPLTNSTPPAEAELAVFVRTPASSVAEVDETNDGGFVMGNDGKGLHLQGGSTLLGFNYTGSACIAAGVLSKTG